MNVDGLIIGSRSVVDGIDDNVLQQLKNVASLPGIVGKAIALPDTHSGYGFPIGCVAAFDKNDGIVSVGGVGYDINCGVRMVTTNLIYQDIEKKVESLMKAFYRAVPCGVGTPGRLSLTKSELTDVLEQGAGWVIKKKGYGKEEELDYIEDNGMLEGANPEFVSDEAIKRERNQLGTLGSGNHFLEMEIVDEVFDIEKARVFGLFKNQVVVTFHTGSRGIGHQVATDYLKLFAGAQKKYGINIKDKELVYVPAGSDEARKYLGAMRAASNFAYANRQTISHYIHEVFNDIIKDVETNTMYDLSHNTIREEVHKVGSTRRTLLVHRKGSTRNFTGKTQEVNRPYRVSGQPIIVGGSMGTASYVLAARDEAVEKTFASTVHGAGRVMSRTKARKTQSYEELVKELAKKNIFLKAKNREEVLEEGPNAYKDIEEVITSISKSGLSQRVARLKPIGVIKG